MKKFITLLLALFAVAAMAEDVVYLNNGKLVKGKVIKDDGTTVEVKLIGGDILTYKALEIRKIDKDATEIIKPETPNRAAYIDYETQKKGWWCAVEFMGGGTVDVNYDPHLYNVGLSFINGYRFNQFIRIGIGVGFRYYIPAIQDKYKVYDGIQGLYEPKNADYNKSGGQEKDGKKYNGTPWSIPLFIDIRGNLISNDTRTCVPYWAFDLGFSFSNNYLNGTKAVCSEDENANPQVDYFDQEAAKASLGDGIFFAPTLGIKIGTPRHTLLLGITYMGQVLPRWKGTLSEDNLVTTTRFTSFMCGKIAYEF